MPLKKCKKYPSLSEMFEFIALADGDCTRAEQPEPEAAVPAPAISASASEQKKKRIAAMLAAAKTGDYKKHLNVLPELEMIKNFMILQGSCFRMLLQNGLVITVLNWTGL